MTLHHFMLFLHIVGVAIWVGGMALLLLCLRPASQHLAPEQRMTLWAGVLRRFFVLVWGAIALLVLSGGAMLFKVGMAGAPPAWHAMTLTGGIMIGVFISIWLGPWAVLRSAVVREDWARGAIALNLIGQRVKFNLMLGVLTIAVATLGLGIRG